MRHYYFIYIFLGIFSTAHAEQDTSITRLPNTYRVPKDFVEIFNAPWAIPRLGLMSAPLSFVRGDTITYSISRARKRNAELRFDNALLNLFTEDLKGNILTGTFVVNIDGTYLFKLKNRSLLSNGLVLQVRKNPIRPPKPKDTTTAVVPLTPEQKAKAKQDSLAKLKPIWAEDTVATTVYDSVVYMAADLNLKQKFLFPLPIDSLNLYNAYLLKAHNIVLQNAKGQTLNISTCEDPAAKGNKDRAFFLIYLVDRTVDKRRLPKGSCGLKLSDALYLKNEDKVVGKYVQVQVQKVKAININKLTPKK